RAMNFIICSLWQRARCLSRRLLKMVKPILQNTLPKKEHAKLLTELHAILRKIRAQRHSPKDRGAENLVTFQQIYLNCNPEYEELFERNSPPPPVTGSPNCRGQR